MLITSLWLVVVASWLGPPTSQGQIAPNVQTSFVHTVLTARPNLTVVPLPAPATTESPLEKLPATFRRWWHDDVFKPMRGTPQSLPVNFEQLLVHALDYSAQVRAKSAVASRESDLIRARVAIEYVEAKIRSLVNAPHLQQDEQLEFLPGETPFAQPIALNLRDAVVTAMEHRPEITQAATQIDAAAVRVSMSENELQPVLNFVKELYVAERE